jgi:Icc protein
MYDMTDCCGLTRRQLLALSAAGASAVAAAPLLRASRAAAAARASTGLSAQDLELVTVTDDSFILTWYTADAPPPAVPFDPDQEPAPVATDGIVLFGTHPARLDRVAFQRGGDTAYHYVEVIGLRPGTTYFYQALSGGVAATPRLLPELTFPPGGLVIPPDPTAAQLEALLAELLSSGVIISTATGSVTTLVPPRGRLLLTVALSNDIHIGETVSGLATANFPPGFSQQPGLPPYPVVMCESMTRDAARRGAEALIVAGDLSSAALPTELSDSRSLLDGFGRLRLSGRLHRGSYVVARGNHDQPKTGAAYEACTPVADGFFDCLPAVYDLPQGTLTVTELGGLRLVGLDTTTLDTPGGALDDAQFATLQQVLASDPEQPTLVFGHHPVTDESADTTIAGPSFDLDRADAARLEALYAQTPGVFFHHSGHTHRNLRTSSPAAPGVEFLEVAATKEYPGGFSRLRIYEGGYLVSFYKSSSALARQWSQTSSGEYLGLYPAYTLGSIADRNHVVSRDFSALARRRR